MDTKDAKSGRGRGAARAGVREARTNHRAVWANAGALARSLPKRDVLALLAIIVAVGAALRFHGLAFQSLWLDELWTWHMANYPRLSDVLNIGLGHEVHPPLYFILHYYLQKYIGDSETILRLPSAVAGVLTIPVIYLLGRRLYSDVEGLAGATLMAALWCPVYYSQEARAYMIMMLFSMLSMYFWIPLVASLCRKERPGLWTIVGFSGVTLVAGGVHYYGLLLVGLAGIAAAVVLAVKQPRALPALPLFYLPLVVVYVPWLDTLLASTTSTRFGNFYFGMFPIIAWFRWAFNAGRDIPCLAALGILVWLFARTVHDAARKRKAPDAQSTLHPSEGSGTPYAGLLLVLWLVVPFALSHLQSAFWRPTLTLRNMMICTPAAYLLVARGIARIPVRRAYHLALIATVFAGLLADLLFGMHYYTRPTKDQYREAVGHIVQNNAKYPNSLIVGWKDPLYDYYFAKLGSRRRVNMGAWGAADARTVAEVVAKYRVDYIWLVHGHWALDPEFEALLKSRYSLLEQKSYIGDRGGGVLLFKTAPPPAMP